MKQNNFLKITIFCILAFFSAKTNAQSAGDIAFIAFNADGDDEFAFVTLVDIPANTSIWFTDNEWDGDSFNNINEGEVEWTYTSILPAGSVVVIAGNAGTLVAGLGTVSGSGINLGASNETLYALLSEPSAATMLTPNFLAGISSDESGSGGTLTGTGLTSGTNFIDFADDNDGYKYIGSRSSETSFGDYLPLIMNTANWQIETSDGSLILPISITSFTAGPATPGITLSAVLGNTNETGTTATFTAVLNVEPLTDVVLNVSSGDLGEVTVAPSTLTFTNLNWATPQTVTATGVDDALTDGNVDVTITVAVNDATSDDAYDGLSETTTVTNEDDDFADIVISEIMYNTDTPGSDDEWIELYNDENSSVDINGYSLEYAGNTYNFVSATVIPSKGYITIAVGSNNGGNDFNYNAGFRFEPDFNTLGFTNFGDLVSTISGGDTNKLTNSSATITLKDAGATVIDTVTYDDAHLGATTGTLHDGGGNSLEIIDVNLDNSVTNSNWRSSSNLGGSPGASITSSWSGATSEVWNLAGNWDNGIPTSSMNVFIPVTGTRPTTGAIAVNASKVLISSGASLNAKDATSFNASVTYLRSIDFVSGDLKGWFLIASPVVGQDYNDSFVASNNIAEKGSNRGIATYKNSDDSWTYLQGAGSGTFNEGQGYSVKKGTHTTEISFTGTLNLNNSGQDFTLLTGLDRFNALGNPYTSYINSVTFLNNEAAISDTKTLWVWNRTLGDDGQYEVKTVGSAMIIAPGQGFFVKANAAGTTTFNFDETNQSHNGTDTFQKSAAKTEIKLSISDGTINNYNKIHYLGNATTGFDIGYEGELFTGQSNTFAIYSHLISNSEGKNYQIQSLPNSNYEDMVIPVGLNADAGKEITFTSESLNLPTDIKVFLEDRFTNTFTRLDEANSNYKITLSEKSNGIGRFFLHTKSSSVLNVDKVNLENISIYKSDNETLRIVGLSQGKASIKLFNILGKQMVNTSFSSNGLNNISLPKLARGIYIVQLETENGTLNKKITLE